jgi:hypothetical protein
MTGAPPRILKVEYRSALKRRVATFYCKVPRGGAMYELNEALTRLLVTQQAKWVKVTVPGPGEITPDIREENHLKPGDPAGRWLPRMETTTSITEVDLNA